MRKPLHEVITNVVDFFRNKDMTIQLKRNVIYCPNTRRAMSVTLDMIDVLKLVFKEYGITDWAIHTQVFSYDNGEEEKVLVIDYGNARLHYIYKTIDEL